RAKTRVEMGKSVHDVTLHVRIERDRAIWLSVTAILGVEAARILITPDSVKILNKLQGEYISKPFAYIYNYTNRELHLIRCKICCWRMFRRICCGRKMFR